MNDFLCSFFQATLTILGIVVSSALIAFVIYVVIKVIKEDLYK